MIEDEVVEHGGGGAPQSGVDAESTDTSKASDVHYTVSASGVAPVLSIHVERTRSTDGDRGSPGVAGGPSTITVPSYDFAVTSREGEC